MESVDFEAVKNRAHKMPDNRLHESREYHGILPIDDTGDSGGSGCQEGVAQTEIGVSERRSAISMRSNQMRCQL
jgi:hypothetical protein